jgi:predicted regulator of Ras-like GTPase activity (Roadblock/LC7/MglB family)
MSMSTVRADELSDILRALQTSTTGLRAAFLASVQGGYLASTQISGMERVQLGGISAASLAIAAKGVSDLQLGGLHQIHIAGDAGSIVLLKVAGKAVLTLVLDEASDLAAALKAARKAVPRLDAVL